MKSLRIEHINRGQPFKIEVDGEMVEAYRGETIATVLMAAGIRMFRQEQNGYISSRVYCNMGVCQQCLVTINQQPNCQACKTLAEPGMKVETRP
jgi:succinate dehydrogenase/fumarate reductase-like Fe-S protein